MRKTFLKLFMLLPAGGAAGADRPLRRGGRGRTPGGIMAAIAASREGKTVALLERSEHIGGLPANGLGATDIATRGATTGLFAEFVGHVRKHYADTYGPQSEQVRACSDGYHFEPHVAALVLDRMLQPERDRVTVLTRRQFDALPRNVDMEGGTIRSIAVTNRDTRKTERYAAQVFIDATYEGDLGAAAGVPFSIGREGQDEYNEIGAGRLFKLWDGPELEGTTHQADQAVQAYNYRLCLTNDPDNRLLPQRPRRYDRRDYVSLIDDVYDGTYAGVGMLQVTPDMQAANRAHLEAGGTTQIPGDPWGIAKVTNMVDLPNRKTDANNQHLALISTDLPEENWPWPTADWRWRDRFAQRLKDYTLGLLWFAQNDEALPEAFRQAVREWGLARTNTPTTATSPARCTCARDGGSTACTASPRATPCPPPKANARPSTPPASPPATTPSTRTPCASASRDASPSTAFFQLPLGGLYRALRGHRAARGGQPAHPRARLGHARGLLHPAHGAVLDGPGAGRRDSRLAGHRRRQDRARSAGGRAATQAGGRRGHPRVLQGRAPHPPRLCRGAAHGPARLPARMGSPPRPAPRPGHRRPLDGAERPAHRPPRRQDPRRSAPRALHPDQAPKPVRQGTGSPFGGTHSAQDRPPPREANGSAHSMHACGMAVFGKKSRTFAVRIFNKV